MMKKLLTLYIALTMAFMLANLAEATTLIDNGDGTITDLVSGLMWIKNANCCQEIGDYDSAEAYVEDLVFEGFDDWRLPKGSDSYEDVGELEDLYYRVMEGLQCEEEGIPPLTHCKTPISPTIDPGPFENVLCGTPPFEHEWITGTYWVSGFCQFPAINNRAFSFISGEQECFGKDTIFGIWPVRDVDVIYVDADAPGRNNGSSWADAFNHLQDALAVAPADCEIRVAEGIYKPDQDTDNPNGSADREATFQLKSGVAIYGGYAGFDEPDPDDRDIDAYETILSGDLEGDDIEVANPSLLLEEDSRSENSYHVVTTSGTDATCILDGFTIKGGNANGPDSLYDNGGGIYNGIRSETDIDCSPIVNNCTFIGNSALSMGGGIYNGTDASGNNNCSPIVTNCTFIRNLALRGGGMGNEGGINNVPTVINCTFNDNWACYGGGMGNSGIGEAAVTNCMFIRNRATEIPDVETPTPVYYGGGISSTGSYEIVTNCTFSGNSAGEGGGIYNSGGQAEVTNCILWGNSDDSNSIESAQISVDSMAEIDITYSCIQGWTGNLGGEGNIGDDPLFVDVNTDNLRLGLGSPCIDTGNDRAVPPDSADMDGDSNPNEPTPFDLDGNPRFVYHPSLSYTLYPSYIFSYPQQYPYWIPRTDVVDMGAYEAQAIYQISTVTFLTLPDFLVTYPLMASSFPLEIIPLVLPPGTLWANIAPNDSDGDGVLNHSDMFPFDPDKSRDTDRDGEDDTKDHDDDNDNRSDGTDAFPKDGTRTERSDRNGDGEVSEAEEKEDAAADTDGDGKADAHDNDIDGDGVSNEHDVFPYNGDEWKDTDGDGVGDNQDKDDDSDGIPDENDAYPCFDNNTDSDEDTIPNIRDAFPSDNTQWSDRDGDGYGDNPDGNNPDRFPDDSTQWSDRDGDGYGDNPDGNNPDRFPDDPTQWADRDNDGYGDNPNGNNPDRFPDDPTQWAYRQWGYWPGAGFQWDLIRGGIISIPAEYSWSNYPSSQLNLFWNNWPQSSSSPFTTRSVIW
ncbi:MAG: hypothetical protein ACMUJM_07970 [bacterium]